MQISNNVWLTFPFGWFNEQCLWLCSIGAKSLHILFLIVYSDRLLHSIRFPTLFPLNQLPFIWLFFHYFLTRSRSALDRTRSYPLSFSPWGSRLNDRPMFSCSDFGYSDPPLPLSIYFSYIFPSHRTNLQFLNLHFWIMATLIFRMISRHWAMLSCSNVLNLFISSKREELFLFRLFSGFSSAFQRGIYYRFPYYNLLRGSRRRNIFSYFVVKFEPFGIWTIGSRLVNHHTAYWTIYL